MLAVTATEWVAAGAVLIGSVMVMLAVSGLMRHLFSRRSDAHSLVVALVVRMVRWAILIVGLVIAAGVIGLEIGPMLGALGLGGLALALALQPVLQNLFAGLVIQTERPIDRGDEIETNGFEGTVVDVTARALVLETFTGEVVHIPNSLVLDNPILNRTRRGRRRTRIDVGVAYGTDIAEATKALRRAVADTTGLLISESPFVVVDAFGESSIDFRVEFWHEGHEATERDFKAWVITRIQQELAAAGITIPFPQRDVWLKDDARDAAPRDQPQA